MKYAAGAAVLLFAFPVAAHGGGNDGISWSPEPWLLAALAVALLLYVSGTPRSAWTGRRALMFAAGWLTVAAAAASPLHEAGERSFTLHMIEHELLMLVAAPLLVLSRPAGAFMRALPGPVRRAFGRTARASRGAWRFWTAPVIATLAQAAALWLWHAPSLFDLALGAEAWHIAQHLSFFVTALVFWYAMVGRHSAAHRGLAAICLFVTSIVTGALGALMAFSQSPWYARYALLGMAPFGLTPAEDQQLAGLLMWIPGGLVHAGAAFAIVYRVLAAPPPEPRWAAR